MTEKMMNEKTTSPGTKFTLAAELTAEFLGTFVLICWGPGSLPWWSFSPRQRPEK